MNQSKNAFSTEICRVINFDLLGDYTIRIKFDDNTEQVVDFEPILQGPVFGPLRDPELFRKVNLDKLFGTLEWPNGADIDPSVLHDWPNHVDAIIQRQRKLLSTAGK
jgi:hypothetical protein